MKFSPRHANLSLYFPFREKLCFPYRINSWWYNVRPRFSFRIFILCHWYGSSSVGTVSTILYHWLNVMKIREDFFFLFFFISCRLDLNDSNEQGMKNVKGESWEGSTIALSVIRRDVPWAIITIIWGKRFERFFWRWAKGKIPIPKTAEYGIKIWNRWIYMRISVSTDAYRILSRLEDTRKNIVTFMLTCEYSIRTGYTNHKIYRKIANVVEMTWQIWIWLVSLLQRKIYPTDLQIKLNGKQKEK